jgi:N-acetylglucosamine kinase-like BadF-type ATPase
MAFQQSVSINVTGNKIFPVEFWYRPITVDLYQAEKTKGWRTMYVIGIDSGGTHIVAIAFNGEEQIAQAETAGGGNIALDAAGTVHRIVGTVEKIFQQLPAAACAGILVGIAGVATAGGQDQVVSALHELFAGPVVVISDADLAMLNGLHGKNGVVAIAGTGSIVLAQTPQGRLRVGGWGWRFGDEGSAYDIARRAFQTILSARDHGRVSPLEVPLCAALQVPDYRAAVSRTYQMDRGAFAGLARAVAQAATPANLDARGAVIDAANALSDQITLALVRTRLPAHATIALTGSVPANNDLYFQVVTDRLGSHPLRRLQGSNAPGVQYYRFR